MLSNMKQKSPDTQCLRLHGNMTSYLLSVVLDRYGYFASERYYAPAWCAHRFHRTYIVKARNSKEKFRLIEKAA